MVTANETRAAQKSIAEQVRAAKTSFYWPMRLLPEDKRAAMFAVYAFARAVDDIADEPAPQARKLRDLDNWQNEITALYRGTPRTLIGRALHPAVTRFALPPEPFYGLIEGMRMDARGPIVAPPSDELRRYCHHVAGVVGLLSVRVFGRSDPPALAFAETLGEAVQLTNILRDVEEDAADGRLYLPREALLRAGFAVSELQPDRVIADPRLAHALNEIGETAAQRFAEARTRLDRAGRHHLGTAMQMMALYHLKLQAMRRRGWQTLTPVRVGKLAKLRALLRPA